MNAKEAKEKATANKAKLAAKRKEKNETEFDQEVETLHTFFRKEIDKAVSRGHNSITPIMFPTDRFSDDVVREVNELLRADGFHLEMQKNNGFRTTKFLLGWTL